MVPIPADVAALVDAATPAVRRRDAGTLLELMSRVTGETPHRWGTIVGFGSYHSRYASGREGDAPAAGFAPRKAAMSIYLSDGIESHAAELARLGPHTHGVGCLYVKDLAALDLDVLEAIIAASYARLTAGTFGGHTRDATSHDTPASGDALPKVGAPAARAFRAAGYETLSSLAGADRRALLSLHGVGPRGLAIVDAALAAAGHEPLT